ncbi:MAG: KilA-N domain-containing protein [Saprospiraceae bacterium]
MANQQTLVIEGTEIVLHTRESDHFVSITDIARHKDEKNAGDLVKNWMRTGATINFLGEWEKNYNPSFNWVEFDQIRIGSTNNSFVISTKEWISRTNAIGVEARAGRYGGTFGHLYIALHFANWMDVSFYLKFVDGYVKMIAQLNPALDVNRLIAKANYHIQAAAVRESLPMMAWNTKTEILHQASELDMLNMIVWGMTAREWKLANPSKKGNMRDHANKLELVILNNLQAINAILIEDGMKKADRAEKLLRIATTQMQVLLNTEPIKKLNEV